MGILGHKARNDRWSFFSSLFFWGGGGEWLGMEWEDFINKQGNYIEWLMNSSLTTDTKQKGPHAKSKEPYTLFFKDHLAKA